MLSTGVVRQAKVSQTITLIVHGTFASEARWWRLGADGEATFADRLEDELSRRGLSGTVWKPALVEGFDYPSFSWSGLNRHRDRVRGARRLSSSLNQFARSVQATPDAPLIVNLVAHSHGGNVVLEALRHLNTNVRVGGVTLLGTPLVTVRPALRIARLVFSLVLISLFLLILIYQLIQLANLIVFRHFVEAKGVGYFPEPQFFFWTFLLLIPYGWEFWGLGCLLDVTWRIICRVGQPIAWLRGKTRGLVYGPSLRRLTTILGGRPILLLTSYNDEADLLLQVGSAPARLYSEYVAKEFSIPGRLLEFVFLRPFLLGTFLKALGMFFQVLSLGFSGWNALVQDFEVASVDAQPYYPAHLLVQERLDLHPRTGTSPALLHNPIACDGAMESSAAPEHGLLISLQEVTEELKRQIQLRHSAYYEDDATIVRIAEFLTGAEVTVKSRILPAPVSPPHVFWERLLIANAGLWALSEWAPYPTTKHLDLDPFLMAGECAVFGYIFPFAALSIGLVIYRALKRPMPARLWHWFWVLWGISACICLLVFTQW